MSLDRKYLIWALGYLAVGLCLGIYMATSKNHEQYATHAHINLVGFLLSFGYAIVHKLWLGKVNSFIAQIQFFAHQTGSLIMFVGLFLLLGNFVPEPAVGPVVGVASIFILISALLMLFMVITTRNSKV